MSAPVVTGGDARVSVIIRGVRDTRDGEALRVLVDRLWPRGVTKERADLDMWPKDLTPSSALRKEMHGGELTYDEFAARYGRELEGESARAALDELVERARSAAGPVALVLAGDATRSSHATVLRRLLLERLAADDDADHAGGER